MIGQQKQDWIGHWQTAGEQAITAEQLTMSEH